MKKQDAARIYAALLKRYPDARDVPAAVARGTPFDVLILTILSAQTTDKAVLKVKKPLFSKYPTPAKLAKAKVEDVRTIIHSLGYYHAKAKNIIAASQALLDRFSGNVSRRRWTSSSRFLAWDGRPQTSCSTMRSVRTRASRWIPMSAGWQQRIGFSDTDNVEVIERDLMALFPRKDWGDVTDVLIAHGRATCDAKKPLCEECVISRECRYFKEIN